MKAASTLLRNAILIALCVLLNAGQLKAEERPDKGWTKYLEGSWRYDISDGPKGVAVWTYEADGQSMIGRFQEGDSTGVEIGGWQPDTKTVMVNGYGSKGDYWQLEYKRFSDKGGRGPIRGRIDDVEYSGDFEATIVDENRWGWTIKGKTSKGEKLDLSATFKRVKPNLEHVKAWQKFLVGEWTYEISPDNVKGEVTWSLDANGQAMIGRFKESDGSTAIEVSGWQADRQVETVNGFSSNGGYWFIELKGHTADSIAGRNFGRLPDGRTFNGYFTGKKVNENHYRWEFKGKTGDGKELLMTGKYTRKAK